MLAEVVGTEILSGRALDYRRNTIAIACLLIVLYAFPNIDWSGLTFFGIKASGDGEAAKYFVIKAIWIALLYHFIFLCYYGWRDWRVWWNKASTPPSPGREHFPEWRMFVWMPPKKKINRLQKHEEREAHRWKFEIDNNFAVWRALPPGSQENAKAWRLPYPLVRRFREKLLWFAFIDLGFPVIMVAIAFVFMTLSCISG